MTRKTHKANAVNLNERRKNRPKFGLRAKAKGNSRDLLNAINTQKWCAPGLVSEFLVLCKKIHSRASRASMTEKAVNYDLTTRLAVANAGLVAHGACGITPNAWKRFKRALMRAPANYVSVQGK